MALLSDPRLLILDEPTTGMDVQGRRDFWSAIRQDAQQGRTVMFATHYLDEAETLCDRIGLLFDKSIEVFCPRWWTAVGSVREGGRFTRMPLRLLNSRTCHSSAATKPKSSKEPRLSRTHAPVELSPVEWQRALRRQFGREQVFGLENIGT
jgi:energy-coupling factor transporter ATP-binding protein EcfA2